LLGCGQSSNQNNGDARHKAQGVESKFETIFNGKNLEGWLGDPKYWSVKDGMLIGTVLPENLLKRNSFIIYQNAQPQDFELKLEYKISQLGNSGVNYRSTLITTHPFALKGYQADIDGKKRYVGQNYEEKKRTTLAYMGEKVSIPTMPDSIPVSNLRANIKKNCWQSRYVEIRLATREDLKSIIHKDWNALHLIVKGNRMQHYVNDVLMSDVTDLDTINRTLRGYIGMQVHTGPPMEVAYRNIQLKLL
jgi:hypothetical protein